MARRFKVITKTSSKQTITGSFIFVRRLKEKVSEFFKEIMARPIRELINL